MSRTTTVRFGNVFPVMGFVTFNSRSKRRIHHKVLRTAWQVDGDSLSHNQSVDLETALRIDRNSLRAIVRQ